MFPAKTLHHNLGHSSFWNPQGSFWFSHCRSLLFVDCSPRTFHILRCPACCRPSGTWITVNRFSTISDVFVPRFYLCCTRCIVSKSLLNDPNNFHRGMFKVNAISDADSLPYLLSHFKCDGHTGPMLTQQHLPAP